MHDSCHLERKIAKLNEDHKAYIEFGAMCFIGILVTGIEIDHTHDPLLWLVLLALIGSFVAAIVIGVKKDLEKERYVSELQSLASNPSNN